MLINHCVQCREQRKFQGGGQANTPTSVSLDHSAHSALTFQLCFLLHPQETKGEAHTYLWLVLLLLLNVLTSASGSQNMRLGQDDSVGSFYSWKKWRVK